VVGRALARVVEIPRIAPAVTAPPAPSPAPTPAPVAAEREPSVELLGVAVDPPVLAPGATLRLEAVFRVDGLPDGATVTVGEWRQLHLGERALFREPRGGESQRGNGVHRTALEFTLPEEAQPGLYRFELILRALGREESGEALFEVQVGRR
jgi:hypothetical protein